MPVKLACRHAGHAARGYVLPQLLPRHQQGVVGGNLLLITPGLGRQQVRLAPKKQGFPRQVFQQAAGLNSLFLLEQSNFPGRRDGNLPNLLPRHLGDGIKMAQRLQFVAKKFQSHRPRTGQRPDIHDPSAHGQVPLLSHLRLRFVRLLFKPFDQIQRVQRFPPAQLAHPLLEFGGRQGLLQQRGDIGHQNGPRRPLRMPGQSDQSGQAFADHVRMGQARLVRQDFPVRVEKRFGLAAGPGFHVLLKPLLCFQAIRDDNDGPVGEQPRQQRRHERLRAGADRVQRQHSPFLHAPAQGLRGGSCGHDRKDRAGRLI